MEEPKPNFRNNIPTLKSKLPDRKEINAEGNQEMNQTNQQEPPGRLYSRNKFLQTNNVTRGETTHKGMQM
jgi:hypothetical protein